MSDPNPKIDLTEEQRTEIVAYLDGELDSGESERIRRLLVENANARREAEELTIAFEALDSLDGITASGDFTNRTMTSIQALAETDATGKTQPFDVRRGAKLGVWGMGIVVSAIAGFCATNWTVPDESRDLVRELELLQALPKYERVGSAELLRELEKQELFNE
ncbi:MAG: anti-sigma factor [Planctomycetaceae bacterium]